ncbi:glucosamine-6-phosphate deaminase [candidate division KSB1 bacterium]|nr:MAG: glucosamine-6-phosphate deaminase [candidate division KSB1 bacterium]RKY87215.1 MAG: glucosamine-6-phosphate deaminase [candidate division KSB1 bacterium]
MFVQQIVLSSNVEKLWLKRSGRQLVYPKSEHIGVIEVSTFPALGKLAALRFIEWVQENPGGVIALPTGKTPEYFIKWVTHYLKNWDLPEVQKDLETEGVNPAIRPDMRSLHFVQIDEFYPIDPSQANSFYYYVNKFYIDGFGLDRQKALLIDVSKIGLPKGKKIDDIFPDYVVDLSLRTRQGKTRLERMQKAVIEQVDQWCTEYESKIRELGGIGFFLGGIGPDGHIAFNVRGSDLYSTTRLTPTNYETQAAAATDLGGIEVAKNRLVITIGLATITYRKDAVAIIIAAGEAKAEVVRDAIQQSQSNLYPATALHSLPAARFYLTKGAAHLLTERAYIDIKQLPELSQETIERVVIDLALQRNKRIRDLTEDDFKSMCSSAEVLERSHENVSVITDKIEQSLIAKIERGRADVQNKSFMHIGPHHDDIMLGYLPYIVHLVRPVSNTHTFNYATSGFTAVTNSYMLNLLKKLKLWINSDDFQKLINEDYFRSDYEIGRDRDVFQYLDGIAANSQTMKGEAEARRLLRNLIFLFEESSVPQLLNRIDELINYFKTQYPGKKDLPHIQRLKGMIREWEADLLWGYFGFNTRSVNHIRLGFYKGEIFTERPEMERDVMPIYRLMEKQNPDIVSVALDPEASGPDTHYKVLLAVTEALRLYEKKRPDVQILGYRNVWYRFHPSEANVFVPVSLNSMAIMENSFMNCFGSQREASFPSYQYDGPFCKLAQKIMLEQYQAIKICLGREFFGSHPSPRLRATHGLVFLCQMDLNEFYRRFAEVQKWMENL